MSLGQSTRDMIRDTERNDDDDLRMQAWIVTAQELLSDSDRDRAELKTLREKLALIEVTAALWEAGANQMEKDVVADPAISRKEQNIQQAAFIKAGVARAHAEQVRAILKGE